MNDLILVVDDEPRIARLARDYLEKAGFGVRTAVSGTDALLAFRQETPQLVLLDLTLPGMDGLDVCRAIRRESDVPIIMLTARAEEVDQLIGLELGADDYITKPFSPRMMVARVRAVLRRAGAERRDDPVIRVRDLTIDRQGYEVQRRGTTIPLSRTEFSLLAVLADNSGHVLTRGQLLEQLHGFTHDGYDRSIDAHIKNLRRKLEDDAAEPRYIVTVYGIGYKFDAGA